MFKGTLAFPLTVYYTNDEGPQKEKLPTNSNVSIHPEENGICEIVTSAFGSYRASTAEALLSCDPLIEI